MISKKLAVITVLGLLFLVTNLCFSNTDGFYAYYTKVEDNETALERKHTGRYADVVVNFEDDSRVVFYRHSSFLPFYQNREGEFFFDEIVERKGDGTDIRPDKINKYSYARIIESNENKAVIHWRYIPDFDNLQWDGIVDEYFTITPDKKIKRTIKEGTSRIDDWNNPDNKTIQQLQLDENGITEISLTKAAVKEKKEESIEGSPVIQKMVSDLAVHFKFNETKGDVAVESISSLECQVGGPKSLWKKGISGTALQFDGYYSKVTLPSEEAPDLTDGFTAEAWIALGAYPFGWAPIITQSQWGQDGYSLGINERGQAGLHVSIGDKWQTVQCDEQLKLFRWYHIAGSFDKNTGTFKIYIDGNEKASINTSKDNLVPSDSDIFIGLNNRRMPAIEGRIRKGKWPSMYGIDGLIDEVQIYGKALDKNEILNSYENFRPSDALRDKPDMNSRSFPENPQGKVAEKFGAQYKKIKYYETWDNLWRVSDHPDVVVNFDELPVKFVFWRAVSHGIGLITENGKWGGDQSSENYRELDAAGEAEGCCEHMSDKQCRHSHVRIIENTDARVVVHWRYGLVDSRYFFVTAEGESFEDWASSPWGDWADEYWTIYPDGVGIRHLARGKIWGDSWVETMFYSEPGTRPEDNVELKAYTLVNMKGQTETYSWEDGRPECNLPDPIISMINTKSKYRPFNVYPTDSNVETFPGTPRRTKFHWWNHWPAAQIVSDGRGALASDRAAHSSLVWGIPSKDYFIYGLTNKAPKALIPLAKSWNHPPEVAETKGCESNGYDQTQRAYILSADGDEMSFVLMANDDSPLLNPCFVIKNWNSNNHAEININGSTTPARQGVVRDTDGRRMLVVWIKDQEEEKVKFEISKK
ncbi:MAG: LamG domain-containing protein [Planctomycetota bacterium]|jgi:hypothetical protein